MNDFWIIPVVVAAWFLIQGWLLPRLGVST